jgi:hypothetical protein
MKIVAPRASWAPLLIALMMGSPAACSGDNAAPPTNGGDGSDAGQDGALAPGQYPGEDVDPYAGEHFDANAIGGPGNLIDQSVGVAEGMPVDVQRARAVATRPERSLLIRNPAAIEALQDRSVGQLGILLKRLGRPAIGGEEPRRIIDDSDQKGSKYRPDQLAQWVKNPFEAAQNEYALHDQSPFPQRLGVTDNGNPYARLQQLWGNDLNGPNAGLGGGPFRLLAVINRMDLAGEKDARGLLRASDQPRNFGEARLIFGLVDRDWEKDKGDPYPMTFIIEYRLPALDLKLQPSPGRSYPAALLNGIDVDDAKDQTWRTYMERWAILWRELSLYEPNSPEFQKRLLRIVQLFARPENFTALRANLKVRDQSKPDGAVEFELREWYMLLNDQWILIPRKPRDEPYRCISAGGDLAALIDNYWDPGHNDLRMDRVNKTDGNGYEVPRTVKQAPAAGGYDWGNPPRGCKLDDGSLPYEMKPDAGDPADPESPRFTAPFGRIRDSFVWQVANRGGAAIPEVQRHQFAMRTCSGCHSKEAGVFGFHVAPRMPGKEAALSSFLTGADGFAFSQGGVNYDYEEMKGRLSLFENASLRSLNLKPFAGLYRRDER